MRRTPNRAWGTPNWNTITKNSITSCTTERTDTNVTYLRTDTNVTYLLGKTPPILKDRTFLNVATCERRPSSFFPEDANSPKRPVKYCVHTLQGYTKQTEVRIRAFQRSRQTSINTDKTGSSNSKTQSLQRGCRRTCSCVFIHHLAYDANGLCDLQREAVGVLQILHQHLLLHQLIVFPAFLRL